MSEEKTQSVLLDNLAVLATPDGFQKYVLGTKKDGNPRAVYDIVKDYTKPKRKKKKDKSKKSKKGKSTYGFYLDNKKKKKKKKKNKHWHITTF